MQASEKKPESIVALYRGGRLPVWHRLSDAERRAYELTHVDLMLSVAREHGLHRLEGFRLLTPQHDWERFWIIEFPSLGGIEKWITAEMAPPYGSYGYYEYDLARPSALTSTDLRLPESPMPDPPSQDDPSKIPVLEVDRGSIVVLLFQRCLPEADEAEATIFGDDSHKRRLQAIVKDNRLIRLESFELISSRADWHRVWVVEFPKLAGAEAWLEATVSSTRRRQVTMNTVLARKWAPRYFASWVPDRIKNGQFYQEQIQKNREEK